MELLISLLIYILLFIVLFYVLDYVMKLLNTPPQVFNIVKAVLAILLLIFVWSLIAGAGWVPRIPDHIDRTRP